MYMFRGISGIINLLLGRALLEVFIALLFRIVLFHYVHKFKKTLVNDTDVSKPVAILLNVVGNVLGDIKLQSK